MKYAALFISLLLITSVQARTIYNINQSNALQVISNMLSEDAEDLGTSFQFTDKAITIKDVSKCTQVESKVALLSFKEAMDSVLKTFPDEPIPYDEALVDMKDYLGTAPLTLCKFLRAGLETEVLTLYFFNLSSKTHLRIDKTSRQ
jgi:hypothetical protein